MTSQLKHKQSLSSENSNNPPKKKHADVQSHFKTSKDGKPDIRIALDFGTANSTVAFSIIDGIVHITPIEQFPGDYGVSDRGTQVPTIIWYSNQGSRVKYGYEVQRLLELPSKHLSRAPYRHSEIVTRPKLLLDDGAHVKKLKKDLKATLSKLRKLRIIKSNQDVIKDTLQCYFAHTKDILQRDHGLTESSIVEVTLAVPICWSARSNAVMIDCVKNAITATGLATQPRFFMVNEAEAAAMYVLAAEETQLYTGECFILLDCGGGTTDVGTYKIARDHPLRLEEEVIHPKGVVCGSGDLNTLMRNQAIADLQNEVYLEKEATGKSIETIVDTYIMPRFEDTFKRAFDTTKKHTFRFPIDNLRASEENPRLQEDYYVLHFEDMLDIFKESLETIGRLLTEQIELAIEKGVDVDKLVVFGGFGDSPALKHHLKEVLARINTKHGTDIKMITAAKNASATGVAKGALLRAQDKSNGPKRILRRSFGTVYHIPEDPEPGFSDEVLAQPLTYVEYLQESYIWRTLKWFIKAGAGGPESVHVATFTVFHIFQSEDKWEVKEEIYASDTCNEDYFEIRHVKNWGKTTPVGTVIFDITSLREQMMAQIKPREHKGAEYYDVKVRIRLQVIDTNLEFAAFWPADDEEAEPITDSQISFDVRSAFAPGTA